MGGFFKGPAPAPIQDSRFIETIPVDDWNRLVDRYARNRPLRFQVSGRYDYRPPWSLSFRWSAKFGRFEFQVEPGFVDADPVEVTLDRSDAPAEALEREPEEDPLRVRIDERPWIPIDPKRLRKVGTDASGTGLEPVPEYFQRKGVRRGAEIRIDPDQLEVEVLPSDREGSDGKSRRLLRAVDLVLTKRRPSLQAKAIEVSGRVRLEVGLGSSEVLADPAFLTLETVFREPYRVDGFGELLEGVTDDPFDKLKVATIYFLSPDGVEEGTPVSEKWSAEYAPELFKNLNYDISIDLAPTADLGEIFLPLPLAGGVAQPLVDQITEATSREASLALALLNRSNVKGSFYT